MPNQVQKLAVSDFYSHKPLLVHEVHSSIYPEKVIIYDVPLAHLDSIETSLDEGRFKTFSPYMQDYLVAYNISQSLRENFEERLGWISKHVKSTWSFELHMSQAIYGRMCWSFENLNAALMFKLTF